MTDQIQRCARVTVYRATNPKGTGTKYSNPSFLEPDSNGIEITEDFGIEFEVEKSLEKSPNKIDIKIYNLNDQTRADLEKVPLSVHLEAGYDGEYRHLASGDLIRGFSELKGATWETVLQVGDGQRSGAYAWVSKTYSHPTSVKQIVRDAAFQCGFKLPAELEEMDSLNEKIDAHALYGNAQDEIAKLLAPYGVSISTQNGQLVALPDASVLANQAIVISNDSWLLGSPQYGTPQKPGKPATLKFDSMLYPELVPGKKVRLEARSIQGEFKILKVRHSGKTEQGGDWKSSVEAQVL